LHQRIRREDKRNGNGVDNRIEVLRSQPWNRGKAGSVADYGNGADKRRSVRACSNEAEERLEVLQVTVMFFRLQRWTGGKNESIKRVQHRNRGEDTSAADYGNGVEERMKVLEIPAMEQRKG
jgi:hypothetical protein